MDFVTAKPSRVITGLAGITAAAIGKCCFVNSTGKVAAVASGMVLRESCLVVAVTKAGTCY